MKQRGLILIALFVVAAGVLYLFTKGAERRPVGVHKEAPRFTVMDSSGKTVSSGDLLGKVIFVHFWASW